MTGNNLSRCRRQLILTVLLFTALFVISGCGGGGGGGGEVDPTVATVSGYVTKDFGGEALSGSNITTTVKSESASKRAVSGSNGVYSFSAAAGTYDITASKDGRASFKVQDMTLKEGESYTADMVLKPVFNSQWSTTPPTITSIEGITSGTTPSGTVNITVRTSSVNPMRSIELRIGNMGSAPDAVSKNSSTLSFEWDTDNYPPPGNNNYISILAKDVNNNFVQKTVYFNETGTTTSIDGPEEVYAYAITYPYSLRKFYEDQKQATGLTENEIDRTIVRLPRGINIDLKTAPADAYMVGMITWTEVDGADGYVIYRKTSSETQYKIIGSSVSGDYLYYYDYDPSLTIGTTYQYAVAPYNSSGTGLKTAAPDTAFLNRFALTMESPANNASDVSLNPTYSWSVDKTVGEAQFYTLSIWGYNDSYPVFYGELDSITSYTGGPQLTPNTVYAWHIISAYGADSYSEDFSEYMAISVGSVSGTHLFTTQK